MSEKATSATRVLRVLSALKGKTLTGMSNSELAAAVGESPTAITRCMSTLIAEGFAMRHDSGRFSLSVKCLQIAQAHASELARAQGRIDELNQRVNAGANL
jgi:DNA-binding IclR family transcriptional regulator